jgi:hypothetical protein
LWDTRQPISDQQRLQFFLALAEQRVIAAGELGIDPSAALDHKDRSRLDRRALSAVLQQLGYLTLRRGKRRKPEEAETRHPTLVGDVCKLVKIPKSMSFPVDAVRLEN